MITIMFHCLSSQKVSKEPVLSFLSWIKLDVTFYIFSVNLFTFLFGVGVGVGYSGAVSETTSLGTEEFTVRVG